jgi:CspA family cold shock protein
MSIKTGTVKFYNVSKGYGFIIQDDPGKEDKKELFVHATTKLDNINEKDRVQYELGNNKNGLIAMNVKKIPA